VFLRSLRLTNYRSFLDTGTIELRPIVVLVGANSSGKSSLLRFFPLLRQTHEKPTRGPLLWYGDDVDLGDFSNVVCRAADEPRIGVEMDLAVPHPDGNDIFRFRVGVELEEAHDRTHVARLILAP
jgi:hypothetical protein